MINSLSNLIANKYIISLQGGKYVLEEKGERTFPKTSISTNGQTILCKFDEDAKLLPFFENISGVKSLADYVFFVESKNTVYVFITELSTTKIKTYQRDPTRHFIEYIEKTAKRVFKKGIGFEYRYILLVSKLPTKKVTKPGKVFQNNSTEVFKAGQQFNISHYCL